MGDWIYQGKIFAPSIEEITARKLAGFVYLITHVPSGLKYIGQKKLTRKVKLAPLKGQKRKRTEVRHSDWPKYWSSSEKLKELHDRDGDEAFTREILYLCEGKAVMNLIETMLQLKYNVLFSDEYLNGIVNCRINSRQVAKYKDKIPKIL